MVNLGKKNFRSSKIIFTELLIRRNMMSYLKQRLPSVTNNPRIVALKKAFKAGHDQYKDHMRSHIQRVHQSPYQVPGSQSIAGMTGQASSELQNMIANRGSSQSSYEGPKPWSLYETIVIFISGSTLYLGYCNYSKKDSIESQFVEHVLKTEHEKKITDERLGALESEVKKWGSSDDYRKQFPVVNYHQHWVDFMKTKKITEKDWKILKWEFPRDMEKLGHWQQMQSVVKQIKTKDSTSDEK